MTAPDPRHPDLLRALDRFPDEAAFLRVAFLTDPGFRTICEDYGLAREGLAAFEARADAPSRPEVKEYRVLVIELEAEIMQLLHDMRGAA